MLILRKAEKFTYLIISIELRYFYNINFGYSQVLFMGSVPRINCLLAIVPFKKVNIDKV